MNDRWSERLSDYLDGELDQAERAAIESHLATCDDCARTLEGLREVVARGRALENRGPVDDLWPGISARIAASAPGATSMRERVRAPRLWRPRRLQITWPQALAAGFVLMLISGGSVWWALHRTAPGETTPGGPLSGSSGIASQLSGSAPSPAGSGSMAGLASPSLPSSESAAPPEARGHSTTSGSTASFAPGGADAATAGAGYDANYDQAVADLQRTLDLHRAELDTSTVRVVEQNLAIIDRAIVQAQRALAADPASPYLHQHLALQMKLKLDLLRRTAALAAAQG